MASPPPLRPFARPMLVAALGLGLGVVVAARWPGVGFWSWAAALAACTGGAALVAWRTRRRLVALRGLPYALCAGLALVAVGGARMAAWQMLPPDDVAHAARAAEAAEAEGVDPILTLWGHVDGPPGARPSGVRLVLAVDSAARRDQAAPLRGRVQLRLAPSRYDSARTVYPALRDGDRLRITGALRALPARRNPADMDYGAYLRHQGIHATMAVYDPGAVAFLGPDAGPLARMVSGIRAYILRAVERFVRTDDARVILRALLVADRSGIDADTRSAFVETGLMHLLSVSGLHVLFVGLLLYRLLKPLLGRLGFRWKTVEVTRAALTLVLLLGYTLVTGGTVSVQRAFVMAAVWILGTTFERPRDGLNTLGLAAVVLLMIRPAALFDVGFQLSFGAVAALITLMPVLGAPVPERWMRTPGLGWLIGMVLTSVAATLGTAPALLYHFGQLPLAGLVLNVIAIPATAVVLFGGLGCVAFAGWAPWAAGAFAAVAEVATWALLTTSRLGAEYLHWTLLSGYVRDPWLVAATAAGLAALALWYRPRWRWRLSSGAVGLCLLGVWAGVARGDARPRLDVVFLDVGQGDAAVLALPNGRHVLVDAGLRNDHTDAGRWTVVPHLRRFGIDRLDAVVLTHADADHFGGLATVMEAVPVSRIIYNGHRKESAFWLNTLAFADSLGVPRQAVRAGDTLAVDPAVRIRVLSPARRPAPWDDGNDASVVLRVAYGATAFLLTGDAEAGAEAAMVARYGEALASDVVKVPHHGSRTSSTPAFVAAASDSSTAFAVVSVARRNRYGLPDEEPLARWQATGAAVLQTAREGAVWLRSDGRTVHRVAWQGLKD